MVTFRDLWIWKESHELMIEIHRFARFLPKEVRAGRIVSRIPGSPDPLVPDFRMNGCT